MKTRRNRRGGNGFLSMLGFGNTEQQTEQPMQTEQPNELNKPPSSDILDGIRKYNTNNANIDSNSRSIAIINALTNISSLPNLGEMNTPSMTETASNALSNATAAASGALSNATGAASNFLSSAKSALTPKGGRRRRTRRSRL
jgi:hypothetical protein